MKKKYVQPAATEVELIYECGILAGSNEEPIEIELSEQEMGGHQTLSDKNRGVWGERGIWK